MKILVIGGTGPTGPHVLRGLLARGHDVTILHRGVHEPHDLPEVRHIHADPHFADQVEAALGGERFDAVIAMYGRMGMLAEVFAGKCARFIGITGRPILGGYFDPSSTVPRGMKILAQEAQDIADLDGFTNEKALQFVVKMQQAVTRVLSFDARKSYSATVILYPYVYGPRAIGAFEWSVIKRILDKRDFIAVPNAGLGISTRAASINAAEHLLLALDNERSGGHIINCADEDQYSLAQWIELIADAMGAKIDILDLPNTVRWAGAHMLAFAGTVSDHAITDTRKARTLLGYRDVVPARTALAETVRWYLDNPLDPAKEQSFLDPFDYKLEDDLKGALDALGQSFAARQPDRKVFHPYPHPKESSLKTDERGR